MGKTVLSIDGIRALAAIALVAFHVRLPGLEGAFLGVDVFFVLSGYLTAAILMKSDRAVGFGDVRTFVARRLRRIWPLLACVVVVVGLIAWFFGDGSVLGAETLPALLFVANITTALERAPGWLIHTWTLATEMQFYILLSLVFWIGRRAVLPALIAGFVITTLLRLGLSVSGYDWFTVFYMPFSHSSGLFLGALLAVSRWQPEDRAELLSALCIVVIGVLFYGVTFGDTLGFSISVIGVEIATAVLIACLLKPGGNRVAAVLGSATLAKLGLWSYGIYLWHYPIARLVRTEMPALSAFCLTLAISVVLAALTYRFVEQVFYTRVAHPKSEAPADTPNGRTVL